MTFSFQCIKKYHFVTSEGQAWHYNDVIMGAIASQITSLTIVFSTVYLDTDQRNYQSSASLAFAWGIHRRSVNSPHKWPVTRKMFPFDDVITGMHVLSYHAYEKKYPNTHVWYTILQLYSSCSGNIQYMVYMTYAKYSVISQDHYDDVIKWKHFPRYWPFVREIHRWPVNSPNKGQWGGALMFSLIYAWINDWVNNREAGDLRRHRAHYDVIVMRTKIIIIIKNMEVHTT